MNIDRIRKVGPKINLIGDKAQEHIEYIDRKYTMSEKISIGSMSEVETRRAQVMRGVKEGAIKGIVDKAVDGMIGPILAGILPKVEELKLDKGLVEPAVRAALRFAVTMGLAELFSFVGPMANKIIPNTTEENVAKKADLLAQWMRKYAGERIGEDLIKAAMAVFPLIITQFSEIKQEDLMDVLSDGMSLGQDAHLNIESQPAVQAQIA